MATHEVDELSEHEELAGGLTRGEILKRGAALGASAWGVSALFGAGTAFAGLQARELTPTFYQWIYNLYPNIPSSINKAYEKRKPLDAKIAPVQGFGIERFVAEGKKKKSTWDVYVGMTPFVEMAALIDSGVIEPWDKYMPKSVLNDMIPSIRKEATYQGKLWNWPFLLDIIIQSWNGEIVQKAGLDPEKAPKSWDEFIANARKVVSSKAAPFGAVFDAHGWRSLAPIAHTFSTKVYTPAGLFDFTSDAAVNALEVMKQMMEVAPKNILEPGKTDGGVNQTPDEETFAARQAAYYVKYQNAPTRFAGTWPDPGAAADRGDAEAAGRRRLDGVLEHRRGPVPLWREQAAGRRLHAVPHLQPEHLAAVAGQGRPRGARAAGAVPVDVDAVAEERRRPGWPTGPSRSSSS